MESLSSPSAGAGKTVCITGSSKGLGRSLAITFATNGYNVVVQGRDERALSLVGASVSHCGVHCDVVVGDICQESTLDRLAELANSLSIDVLINNAATYVNASLAEMSAAEFRTVIETNLLAPVFLIKKIYPIFQKKQSGLIVNINSLAGKAGGFGESAYSASKHGLRGFSSSFRFEATKDRVRILDVYLGAMETSMTSNRKDAEKFIQPDQAADLIHRLTLEYPTMGVDEVELKRRKY